MTIDWGLIDTALLGAYDTYNMTITVMEGYIYRDGQEAMAGIISLWTLGEVIADF
jgi:hypothetical protein